MKVSYATLNPTDKLAIERRLQDRLVISKHAQSNPEWRRGSVLIIGDRPGPSAPTIPGYHHTPFHSVKHCSGWLNTLLHIAEIPEARLIWLNAADVDGKPLDAEIVFALEPDIVICLGGNAERWAQKNSDVCYEYYKFDHPQYHKRFKNSEEYPLIEFLQSHFNLIEYDPDAYF